MKVYMAWNDVMAATPYMLNKKNINYVHIAESLEIPPIILCERDAAIAKLHGYIIVTFELDVLVEKICARDELSRKYKDGAVFKSFRHC